MLTAFLVDGGFFIKRYRAIFPNGKEDTPSQVATNLYDMLLRHIKPKKQGPYQQLYRIFYYDCPPLTKKAHNPITGKAIDFSKSEEAIFRFTFYEELKKRRKVALRLGHLYDGHHWIISLEKTKALLKKTITIDALNEEDIHYDVRQKGVDMKIGLDIASLAYKHLVDQIILIAGDSDFVPAAKLARREGIDFILDPMWNPIHPDLHEHIDGLWSTCPKPKKKRNPTQGYL